MASSENTSQEQKPLTFFEKVIFVLFLGGILAELIVTGIAFLLNLGKVAPNGDLFQNFEGQLGGLFAIIILVFIGSMLIYIGFEHILVRVGIMNEKSTTSQILVILFVAVPYILIYLFVFPLLSLLQDPFNLSGLNPLLGTIYNITWFFGFLVIAFIILWVYGSES